MRKATILLFILFYSFALSAKPTVCLNMIVKNESHIIKRCIDSVRSMIDYWVIVDTGSTDGTQQLIKDYMGDIPGELYERPWKNFGHNRTEALEFAKDKADYILIMDADDWLRQDATFKMPELNKDIYYIWRGNDNFSYLFPQLINNSIEWKWEGVLHEYLNSPTASTSDVLIGVRYICGGEGSRSQDPDKYVKHAKILTDALKEEPDNLRYHFYLGESYRDAGMYPEALAAYEERASRGGWDEEVYYSLLQIARLKKSLGAPYEEIITAFHKAHDYRPHRPEALYQIAETFNENGRYTLAYECLKGYLMVPYNGRKDLLFNEDWMKDWGMLFQLSIASYHLGAYQESLILCDILLKNQKIPEVYRERISLNREFPLEKIEELVLRSSNPIAEAPQAA